jgi:hypothetical protein
MIRDRSAYGFSVYGSAQDWFFQLLMLLFDCHLLLLWWIVFCFLPTAEIRLVLLVHVPANYGE